MVLIMDYEFRVVVQPVVSYSNPIGGVNIYVKFATS
jgi:hypothetical protein